MHARFVEYLLSKLEAIRNRLLLVFRGKKKMTEHFEFYARDVFCESSKFSPELNVKEQSITLDSVFWGSKPRNQQCLIDRSIILDTNVFSFIRQKPNLESIQKLVAFAAKNKLNLDPSFALLEQRLRHGNPSEALNGFAASIKQNFGQEISTENIQTMNNFMDVIAPSLKENIKLVRDFLPLIKQIWNMKSSFEQKVVELATQIESQNLPRFLFAYLFAATAFYIKANSDHFDSKVFDKVQSDMSISSVKYKEEDRRWNVAFDISIFLYCVEVMRNASFPDTIFLTTIASADVSFPVFAQNIKCCAVDHDPESKRTCGYWGLTPVGCFDEPTRDFVIKEFPKPLSSSVDDIRARRRNLTRLAEELSGA